MLELAISSMALAVFSRTQNHPLAARAAALHYYQLLQLMRTTLPSLSTTNIDDCLLAVFFMGRYEDVSYGPGRLRVHSPLVKSVQSFSHHDGALAILREWKHNLSNHHPATSTIKHARRGVLRSALLRNMALPEWILKGDMFGEDDVDLEYDKIVTCAANLRHEVFAIVREDGQNPPCSGDDMLRIEKLNFDAQNIDKALQDWVTHFPSEWSYQEGTSWDSKGRWEDGVHSQMVYAFSNPAYGAAWNHYFATRALINSTRLSILDSSDRRADASYQIQHSECFNNIRSMAAGLAASLPVSLQRAEGTANSGQPPIRASTKVLHKRETKPEFAALSAWPLALVSSIEHLDLSQKSRFRCELANVGKIAGCGVLECAHSRQWFKL